MPCIIVKQLVNINIQELHWKKKKKKKKNFKNKKKKKKKTETILICQTNKVAMTD